MPQLHETHVLLVHKRRRLGARDVHVVATKLARLEGRRGELQVRKARVGRSIVLLELDVTTVIHGHQSGPADDQLRQRLELDLNTHVVTAGDRSEREVHTRVLREEKTKRHSKLQAGLLSSAQADDTRGRRLLHCRDGLRLKDVLDSGAASLANLLKAVAVRVVTHKLVDDVQVVTGENLDVVGAHREGDLVNHRIPNRLDPRPHCSRRRSARRLLKLAHEVHGAKEVRGLRDHKVNRGAEVRSVLRVDVAQLHLKVGRARVTDVREVRARVVVKEGVLRSLVDLKLRCHFVLLCTCC